MLAKSRWYLTNREKLREFSTRSYYIVRIFVLELGRRYFEEQILSDQIDIFFLKISEILRLNKNEITIDELKEQITLRKLQYHGLMNFKAPNEFGGHVKQFHPNSDDSKLLKGVPCSNGTKSGIAFVAKTLEETKNLKEGEILVTKFTDPGWTPILAKVSAVVTEVGGVLSHAAVISREYCIPAVLNISNATEIIKSGDKIEVNGNSGTVVIVHD